MTDHVKATSPVEVIISLGSNAPDAHAKVEEAIRWLHTCLTHIRHSGVYASRPFGGVGADYANAVVRGTCTMTADGLNSLFKQYESSHGRTPEARQCGLVPVDIDIVYYGPTCLRPGEILRPYYITGAKLLGL